MSPLTDGSPGDPARSPMQVLEAPPAFSSARTQTEVLTAVLTSAIRALGAVAGAVLLVDDKGLALRLAGHQGYGPEDRKIWHDGHLGDQGPTADVLRLRHALYFENAGALGAAYPEIEERTGAAASVVLPMFLDGCPIGCLVLDFTEPHTFGAEEKFFLRTLAAQCAVALDRVTHVGLLVQRLEERRQKIFEDAQAHEAFVAFTEAVGSETNLPTLVSQAIVVLQSRFPGSTVAYYELEGALWKARNWSDDISPALAAEISAGVPVETLLFAQVLQTRQPVFTEAWNARHEGVDPGEHYRLAAAYPLSENNRVRWLLAIGLRSTYSWSEAGRRLVRAVGHGLNLALERTETARRLMLQNVELQARTRALEAFADLTRDLALTTDPLLLIRRTQEVVMPMLADGSALYYELDGQRWHSRVQHGTLHSAELQTAVDAGLPYAETNNLLIPWTTGKAYFQDQYDLDTDQLAANVGHIGATATIPLRVGDRPVGVLAFVLFQQRNWSNEDRMLLETTVQSLELALDRAAKTRTLEEERTALEAFTRFSRSVGRETDVQKLVQQAIVLLEELRSVDVTYMEREGQVFRIKQWNDGFPQALLDRSQEGYSPDQPSFVRARNERQAIFEDAWDAAERGVPQASMYGVLAVQPFFQDGEMISMLLMGSRNARRWADRDKGIFQAVGQSLELALDRARQTRELQEERAALEAFTRFTEQVGSETDVQALVRKAISLLVDICGVDVVYLEREGDLYKATAWNTSFDSRFLLRLQNGFPLKRSSLALILRENTAAFIDGWADHQEAAGMVIEESRYLQAVAGYPLFQEGEMQSVLLMASRVSAIWAEREKRIFRAVGRSLNLALERARQTRTVTAQRDALDVRTRELAASTDELNAFSYSVSHDLRTPVRHMLGFLKLARTSLNDRLDERSARYLEVVEQAGGQMNTLIDAMLNLSNVAQQSLKPQVVDLNEVMAQLQASLIPDLIARNIRWEVTSLPSVYGDRDALKQVLTQLTENALKFTYTRDPAVIRVWAEDQGGTWGVFVQDNGLGFDPRYRDRLFNMFQRLHSAQEATGSGVGLASVRRLILKHGGQVLAEGQVGEGATFGFTLPKRPSPSKGT